MESFEHMGYWWLPQEPNEPISKVPETAIPGKLSFDPSTGGVLELLGNLDTENPYAFDWKIYEIIHGFAKGSNVCVTLQGCRVTSISHRPYIFTETKLIVDCIYRGHKYWFDSVEDIVFENLSVDYTYLNDWMFQKNIEIDYSYNDQEGLKSYSAIYVEPESIEIPLDSEKITIWPKFGGNSSIAEVSIKNEYRISVTPKKPIQFEKYLELINFHLPNFLTLATGQSNFPLNVSGLVSEDRGGMNIFYKTLAYTDNTREISQWPMLFSFDDVKEDLPKYLSNWIRKSEKLEATYDLYFRTQYRKLLVLDSEFLNLAQALEAYHRNVYGGEYLAKEEYEPIRAQLIDAIPDCVDDSHRDALESTLNYGNQYSLRTRLKQIIRKVLAEQKSDVEKLLDNPTDFIHRVVETRNYLSHRDGDPNQTVIEDDELYWYCRKMRMLLQICFLKEMGFPPDEITRLLNANQDYQVLTKDKSP